VPGVTGKADEPGARSSSRPRLERLLGSSGPLARALPSFTPRPHQLALARGVESALREARPCLAEAGTGTGKTVGYLVPLFRYLDKHGGRAILSTHTLALQAQLVERDIPALLTALPDLDIRPVVLKGRYNYLCRQDLDAAAVDLTYVADPSFRRLQQWSADTETGDVADLEFTFNGWSDVAANVDTCRQRECRYYDNCFYYRARKNAEEANLIVVNHSLFFADLRLKRIAPGISALLPPYDAVVFDEAHHVEEMATRAFGLEWGSRRLPQLLYRLRRVAGLDAAQLRTVEQLHEKLMQPFYAAPKSEMFLEEALASDQDSAAFREIQTDLCAHINGIAHDLVKLGEAATSSGDRDRANGLARAATRLSVELVQVARADEPDETSVDYFRWFHTRRLRNGEPFTTLVKTPLAVDSLMQESLLTPTPRTIFVSATLATADGFEYLKGRLGMPPKDAEAPGFPGRVPVEVAEGSPFDYARNCLLYIPHSVGAPTGGYGNASGGAAHGERLTDEVLALIEAARGRTFVLFTSNRMLSVVRDRLWGRCNYPLFVQGEMPNGKLVEAFAAAGDGVLLGTNSFWEGVDVPGPALSCVIIDKLPFASPDSPVQRARETYLREHGGDAFRQLSLPQAQMRLKQGFGRLLRTTEDRGVVAILDSRLWTKGYGREILAALPPCPKTDRIEDVQDFFGPPPLVSSS
jgi:ATP-dependent DNA helicase DinG